MSDFITEIRKIPTDKMLYVLSNISMKMFEILEHQIQPPLELSYNGVKKTGSVMLMGWDIHSIAFHSVINSNDHRTSSKEVSFPKLINLYRGYDNEHSAAEAISNANFDGVFRILMGMTSEQFLFQQPGLIFENFNRDYYILLAADNFEHRSELDVNAIIKDTFGYTADDYIALLLILFWLCSKSPEPLKVMDEVGNDNWSTLLSPENISRMVQYYSCSYEDLRNSPLGKQLLYSKPFIMTQIKKTYITSNMFLFAFTLGNGLYWVVRDYYLKRNSQHFTNTFGLLFEDYINDLGIRYCTEGECTQLDRGKKKGADFLIDFGSLKLLIESKSALLPLGVKQQVPNTKQADTFFIRTIQEAYDQLKSSYNELEINQTVPIIKIILLYDDFSNTGIIEKAITSIFDKDPQCFMMTIRELEILMYLHKYAPEKEKSICVRILSQLSEGKERESIGAILESLDIYDNLHLSGEMDYFQKLLNHFAKQFELNK